MCLQAIPFYILLCPLLYKGIPLYMQMIMLLHDLIYYTQKCILKLSNPYPKSIVYRNITFSTSFPPPLSLSEYPSTNYTLKGLATSIVDNPTSSFLLTLLTMGDPPSFPSSISRIYIISLSASWVSIKLRYCKPPYISILVYTKETPISPSLGQTIIKLWKIEVLNLSWPPT